MSWITPSDVTDAYGASAVVTQGYIDHVQGLAEACIGEQDEPVGSALAAVMVEIVWRKYQESDANPSGLTQEAIGSYSYSTQSRPGHGLTKADCAALKDAVGASSLWVQPVTRGELETAPINWAYPDDESD